MLSLRTALITAPLLAALSFISAGGYGIRLYRFLGFRDSLALEELVFSSAAGYGILSLLMVLAGVLNAWTGRGAWTLLIGGLALSAPFLKVLSSNLPSGKIQGGLSSILLLMCALWGGLLALAPVTYYDSLVYHFALPAAYVQARHWISMKELIYPAFPQNLEMLWTFGLLIGDDTLANFISLLLTGLALAGTYAFACRFLTRSQGRTAVMLLATMPAILLLSSGGYVDSGLMLYVFLSFFGLCRWHEAPQRSWLILAGFLGGLAMGIKYTAGIPFAAGAALVLWENKGRPALALKDVFLYGMTGALTMSPWLIKNAFYVGNPLFPFFYSWGNSNLSPWVQGAAAGYFHGVAEYEPRTLINLLLLPWDIIVHSLRFGGGMDVLGDYGWAPLMVLAPFSYRQRTKPQVMRWLWVYAALFIVPWAFTRPVLRFLLPLAPVLALLAALSWSALTSVTSGMQWMLRGLVGAAVLYGFGVFFTITGSIGQFPVALGLQDRAAYLSGKLNYYAASCFINQLPGQSLTYVVGDQRSYYYNRPVIVTPVFNTNPLTDWANEASSPADLSARIKARHVTHLLINRTEMERLDRAYHIFPFTPRGLANWLGLLSKQTRSLYHDRSCDVLALL